MEYTRGKTLRIELETDCGKLPQKKKNHMAVLGAEYPNDQEYYLLSSAGLTADLSCLLRACPISKFDKTNIVNGLI